MESFQEASLTVDVEGLSISPVSELSAKIPGSMVIRISGELDNKNSSTLQTNMKKFCNAQQHVRILVFDCAGLSYASSTGIGAFVQILMECNKHNIMLYLLGVSKRVSDVFSLLGFSSFFNFVESIDEIET